MGLSLGVARELPWGGRFSIFGRGVRGPGRGRIHRRRRGALFHNRKHVLYVTERQVVLDGLALRCGGSLSKHRNGLLQLLDLMHSLARLQ